MDIVVQQSNVPRKFELDDKLLSTINDILETLITRVDDILIDISCPSSELPNMSINEGEKNWESKQEAIINNSDYIAVPQTGLPNPIKEHNTFQLFNSSLNFKNENCESDSGSLATSTCVKEKHISCKNKQIDFMESTKYMINTSDDLSVLDAKKENKYLENHQNLEPLTEYFEDAVEYFEDAVEYFEDAVEYFEDALEYNKHDVTQINPTRELSPNIEWTSTDHIFNNREISSDTATQRSFWDIESSIDSYEFYDDDFDDEEFIIVHPPKEIGDQEEEDFDNRSIIERIAQYVRETDMLLMANKGGGDHINFDTDEDSDDELVNQMFE